MRAAHNPDDEAIQATRLMNADAEAARNRIFGLDPEDYNNKAGRYVIGNITFWVIAGLIYNLLHGHLVSWASGLLLFPGIFAISFASIPIFYISTKSKQALQNQERNEGAILLLSGKQPKVSEQIPLLILATIIAVLDFLFPIIAAVLVMWLLRSV